MPKRKIAILGGGVGAMTTAFQLTNYEGWQDDHEITVYQLGWRLGGKGASGRNAYVRDRIEEHGLHLWFGFYENAFSVMRQAYQELHQKNLAPGSPFQSCFDAFHPQTRLSQLENVNNEWKLWSFNFPTKPGLPGDDLLSEPDAQVPDAWGLVLEILVFLESEYEAVIHGSAPPTGFKEVPEPVRLVLEVLNLPIEAELSLLHLANRLARKLPADVREHSRELHEALLFLLRGFRRNLLAFVERVVSASDDLRRFLIAADVAVSVIEGVIEDDVIGRGFQVIDDVDFVEWLKRHGCLFPANPLILSLYDGCFAYADGDPNKRSFSAASALYGNLRLMFTYKGSIVWRMQSGMGDVVFAPLYLTLKNRGVNFEFFQRVERLHVSDGRIDAIDIDVQATLKDGKYDPLIAVKGLPCWPNQPRYEQLVEGDEIRNYNLESWYTEWHNRLPGRTLRAGSDFDLVVLGISAGAFPYICQDLIEARPEWRDMVQNLGVTPTKGMQLWLKKTAAEMGWSGGDEFPPPQRAINSCYVELFDTYGDFSQVLPTENWTPADNVQQVAYMCNAFPRAENVPPPFTDPGFPATEFKRGEAQALDMLTHWLPPIWPAGVDQRGALDWNLLVDPEGGVGTARLKSQYLRVNIDPPELYVQALPGTGKYRLSSGKSGFDNLFLAGDWTYTDLNGGCVEAAVISGMMASQAICGRPERIYYLFPEEPRENG